MFTGSLTKKPSMESILTVWDLKTSKTLMVWDLHTKESGWWPLRLHHQNEKNNNNPTKIDFEASNVHCQTYLKPICTTKAIWCQQQNRLFCFIQQLQFCCRALNCCTNRVKMAHCGEFLNWLNKKSVHVWVMKINLNRCIILIAFDNFSWMSWFVYILHSKMKL